MCVCVWGGAWRGQKTASDPLKAELQALIIGTGDQTRVLLKNSSAIVAGHLSSS